MKRLTFVWLSSVVLMSGLSKAEEKINSVEVGTVEWGRNFDEATIESKKTGKPIFLLFQEVPGCQGCQDFGRQVLSNPLIKKSIEDAFVPLMIRNNVSSGHDREILTQFKEPAWNYQVVRFINDEGKDIIPRKDRVWSTLSLANRMKDVLTKESLPTPAALTLAIQESETEAHQVAAFAMHCFWTGEAKLGQINGVVTTEAGWFDGREVTLVKYHEPTLSLATLIEKAEEVECAHAVYLPENAKKPDTVTRVKVGTLTEEYRKAKNSDQKRQLTGISLKGKTFTPAQLTKINAFIRSNYQKAEQYLTSP